MKRILTFLFIFILLAMTGVTALNTSNVAAEASPAVGLCSALADSKYSRVALMDRLEGVPKVDDKDILFIDGEYFLTASQHEVDKIIRLFKKGMPLVFFGGGYERFRQAGTNLPYTESRIDGLPVSTIVEGIAIAKGKYVNGKPVTASFGILGSKITANIVSEAYDYAITIADETQSLSQRQITPDLSQDVLTLSTGSFGNPGPGWSQIYHRYSSSGNSFNPYGKIQSNRYYFASDYEIYPGRIAILQQQRTIMVTGNTIWGSGWRTADLYEELDTDNDPIEDWYPENDQKPSGEYTINIGFEYQGVSIGASWTGYLTSSTIHDYSNPNGGICDWWVDPPQSYETRCFDSGAIWSVPHYGWLDTQHITLQGKWAKKRWYGGYNYHLTSEWMECDSYAWPW